MSTKKKSRGRPRSFDPNRAIRIALELFREKGYDGVGVSELSQAIGVNPPSLYSAFGSKRKLFEKATQLYGRQEGAFITEILARESDPLKGVRELLNEASHVYVRQADCRGCLVIEAARNCSDEDVVAFLRDLRSQTRTALRDYLRPLGEGKAEPLADYLLVLISGLSSRAKDGEDRESLLSAAAIGYRGFQEFLRAD